MTVSIKDVARAAGVAPSTVSRALGKGPVSAEVRALVEAAVAATGYRPNLSARRLRSQAPTTVGLVLADIRNPFFTRLSFGVEDAAYRAGLRVFLCNTDEDPAREAMHLEMMAGERVSGLILAPTRQLQPEALKRLRMPVVLVDRDPEGAGCDAVTLDNEGAMRALVDHVVASGRRQISGLFGANSFTGEARAAGFARAMARHGLPGPVHRAAPNAAAGYAALADWLGHERPEALIVSNGLFLEAAVRFCHDHGLSIPRDLALAGVDDDPWTGIVNPGLTVLRQPAEAMGREALSLLLARLDAPERPRRKLVLESELVPRASTADLREGA
ncbi:LacI family DNA-binding transcriptional regulator [Cereibacter sediminicola]|uniref:LacI family DNA-binding transcriptional regulator n=1 Tax=Cereibacter sediminicola TaxID=2584941 RepID=UPI0011A153A8|nr:LacI family DNA-binding transcriptional regulator [Cereibacter sediminicola]